MPVLLLPLLATIGVTGAFATVAAYGLTAGLLIGGGVLVRDLFGGDHQKVDEKQTVKQATPARVRCYGFCKLGGAYFTLYAAGVLVEGFVHCEGPIHQFKEWWLNDVLCTGITPGSLSGTSGLVPGRDKLHLDSQLGLADQAANPALIAAVPGWGSTRRLRGLANTVMRLYLPSSPGTRFQKYYPGGVPTLRVVALTSLVYDPRDATQNPADDPRAPATWTFSQNAALCIRDYLVHPDGMALPRALINDASFAAMATLCDESVSRADGSTEGRYVVLQGSYDLTEKRADVLKRLLATCDGELYQLGDGTIGIRGGQWTEPTVTIDDTMVSTYSVTQGTGKLAAYNQLRIRYVDVNLDYQQVEGDPWDDTAAQAASGEVVAQDFDAAMSPYNQARRLAKIAMHKANPAFVFELRCSLAALDAFGERIITLRLDDIGFAGPVFVSRFEIAGDLSGCSMTLASLAADAYQWDPTQEGHPAPNPTVAVPTLTTPPVSGLALTLVRTAVTGGVTAAQIQAVVNPPSDESFSLHGQYKASTAADWIDMAATADDWTVLSGIVADGLTYDVRAAFQPFGGEDGAYTSDTIVVVADSVAPASPTGLATSVSGGAVTIDCAAPSSSNTYGVRFYRSDGSTFADATLIGSISAIPGSACALIDSAPDSGTNRYWVTAINHSGVASTPAGPATAVV